VTRGINLSCILGTGKSNSNLPDNSISAFSSDKVFWLPDRSKDFDA